MKLDLGREKIGKLLLAFSIPCIISMLINSIYNIVDQIFIGQGVGTIGNAATNVIFPMIIICNAIAGLIGNGCAANLSLKLGEGKEEEAKKSVGGSVVLILIVSVLVAVLGELLLPKLAHVFGCTPNVYTSAITYGRIILLGAPFMIVYSALSNIIRADGSPKYSMICLVVGAVINLILDPIFIFVFHLGVAGGAWATIIGQAISFIIALCYLPRFKSIDLNLKDYRLNRTVIKTVSLGLSSFITQMTVLALFVIMNNLMTKYGASSKFGSDIPLSVYGVVSKINSIFISSILGISIGAQPIIGYNFGAGNYKRVKEVLLKVIKIGFIIGIFYNILIVLFPKYIISLFITKSDPNYKLFMEFAVKFCRTFLLVCFLNSFEMCSSITIQSLGNVKKATLVSFTRQIILFIPLALLFSHFIGVYGPLYAGPVADSICFIVVCFVFGSEYRKISKLENSKNVIISEKQREVKNILNKHIVVTISREYGSGGRYVAKILSEMLGIKFYDKEIINLVSKESGMSVEYIEESEQKKKNIGGNFYNNDDKLFAAETKVIKKLSKENCVIVGRCSDYILKDKKDVFKVFLYSSDSDKVKRAVKYYGLDKEKALKEIKKINKLREKHYNYYTNRKWKDFTNYDLVINVDVLGVEKTAKIIKETILNKVN